MPDPFDTRTFSTGLQPIEHPADVDRNPQAAQMWAEHGAAITVHVDDLENGYFANPSGAIFKLAIPPLHTDARRALDEKQIRGDLARIADELVEEVVTEEPTGRSDGLTQRTTVYRLAAGAEQPTFAEPDPVSIGHRTGQRAVRG